MLLFQIESSQGHLRIIKQIQNYLENKHSFNLNTGSEAIPQQLGKSES